MRIALAGVGGAALRGHLPALDYLVAQGKIELAAVCDPDPARLAAAATRLPAVCSFPDALSLLNTTQPDLLVVATDPAAHLDLIRLGITHGAHVLCEKPVALHQSDHEELGKLQAQHPQRAVVPVHQYRYTPGWKRLLNFARTAQGDRFEFDVRVERPGTDPHASAPWRNDPHSGGGLADHGVHYLALAYDLHRSMTVESAARSYDDFGREHVNARIRVGTGTLDLAVRYGAEHRQTTLALRSNRRWMHWTDEDLQWNADSTLVRRRRVPALSDRHHVDTLYLPLYEDLLTHITAPGWRDDKWREIMHVGKILVALGRLADQATHRYFWPAS